MATWAAMLAPLSWLVGFKAHSYIHTHMNFIVWQMPFTLFGFALCGAATARAAQLLTRGVKRYFSERQMGAASRQ